MRLASKVTQNFLCDHKESHFSLQCAHMDVSTVLILDLQTGCVQDGMQTILCVHKSKRHFACSFLNFASSINHRSIVVPYLDETQLGWGW